MTETGKIERCKREARRRVVGNKGWKLAAGYSVHYVPWCGDELLYFSPTALGSMSISGCWRDTKPLSVGSIRSNHIPLQSARSTDSIKKTQKKNPSHTNTSSDQQHDTDVTQKYDADKQAEIH